MNYSPLERGLGVVKAIATLKRQKHPPQSVGGLICQPAQAPLVEGLCNDCIHQEVVSFI